MASVLTPVSALIEAVIDTRRVYDRVFSIYVPVGLTVLGVIVVVVLVSSVIYRRRDTNPAARARARRHEHNPLEIAYAVGLALVAAGLLAVTFTAEHQDDAIATERPALTVAITASRWEWVFDYRGAGIHHEAGEVGTGPLVVPVGEPVRFDLRSADVVHSFWIPQVAFKRDAIPGTTEHITLDFDRLGTFSGACAEYCGTYHADMVFSVRVVPDRAFATWVRSHGRAPLPADPGRPA